jgi:hypothetical protein
MCCCLFAAKILRSYAEKLDENEENFQMKAE